MDTNRWVVRIAKQPRHRNILIEVGEPYRPTVVEQQRDEVRAKLGVGDLTRV